MECNRWIDCVWFLFYFLSHNPSIGKVFCSSEVVFRGNRAYCHVERYCMDVEHDLLTITMGKCMHAKTNKTAISLFACKYQLMYYSTDLGPAFFVHRHWLLRTAVLCSHRAHSYSSLNCAVNNITITCRGSSKSWTLPECSSEHPGTRTPR